MSPSRCATSASSAPSSTAFSQIDTSDGVSLSYTLEDIEAAKAKAVEDAYRKARLNAEDAWLTPEVAPWAR